LAPSLKQLIRDDFLDYVSRFGGCAGGSGVDEKFEAAAGECGPAAETAAPKGEVRKFLEDFL